MASRDRNRSRDCLYYSEAEFLSWTEDCCDIFPITMPYYHESTPYKVYIYQGLTDPKNGDWDTTAVLYVIKPYGERVDINRYFDDTDGTREITKEEYQEREKRFVNPDHEKFVIA